MRDFSFTPLGNARSKGKLVLICGCNLDFFSFFQAHVQ